MQGGEQGGTKKETEGKETDLTSTVPERVIHFERSVYRMPMATIILNDMQPQVLSSTRNKS